MSWPMCATLVVSTSIFTAGLCYTGYVLAHEIRLGLREQGQEVKLGMKGLMTDSGSGTDHLAAGLENLGRELGHVSTLLWGRKSWRWGKEKN